MDDNQNLQKVVKALESEKRRRECLPHLYSYRWYQWAWDFFNTQNKEAFLCAANQISKSSTLIRKNLNWATDKSLWPILWPHSPPMPLLWYFYPSNDVATTEFKTKWAQFMPRHEYKAHDVYGWKESYDRGDIKEVVFNSGCVLQFKTYEQKLTNLQASTVYMVSFDEELPVDYLGELQFRLSATSGYLNGVLTPTIGQEFWRQTFEPKLGEEEKFPDAFKKQITLYDCQKYMDGTPSQWTDEEIEKRKKKCATKAEMLKRVYGRFIKSEGLVYEAYDPSFNRSENHPLPRDWHVYSGIDNGSGGEAGHPAGIVFVAVDPTYRKGRVFRAWRGDGIATTSGDTYLQYRKLRGDLKPVLQVYDYSSKDLEITASRMNDTLTKADKSRDTGADLLNTLFKFGMLSIQRDDPELDKLSQELSTLQKNAHKTTSKDDLIDSLRYCAMSIPWDLSIIDEVAKLQEIAEDPSKIKSLPEKSASQRNIDERRAQFFGLSTEEQSVEEELDAWNDLLND